MLSIVIPVYNEAESLRQLHAELSAVAATLSDPVEVIFVDDGSTDASWATIAELARSDVRVRGIRFRRNFGKAAALNAGFGDAQGEIIMTLDADLQDDPREIPRFLALLGENLGCVSGWKQVRHDPWHKVFPSRIFNGMVSWLTGVRLHDHNCGMKCYRREIFDEVRLYGELHRFVPVLAAARGYRVGELVIQHRARQFGRSKYGVSRFIKGFLDLLTVKFLTKYGHRPQHLLGPVGLTLFVLGLLGLVHLALSGLIVRVLPAWDWLALRTTPALVLAVGLLLGGVQLMTSGLIAELLVAYCGDQRPTYSVAERTGQRAAVRVFDGETAG